MSQVTRFGKIAFSSSSSWTTLPDKGCSVVTIQNLTGVDAQVRLADEPAEILTVKTGIAYPFAVTNAKELQIRRAAGTGSVTAELLYD